MQRILPLTALAVCFGASSALAQLTTVIPFNATATAGSTVNAFPWGTAATGWPGLRILACYDSQNFTNAAITSPIIIQGLKWRANDSVATWTGGTYNAATVALSTAAVDYTGVSTTFASNHGPDYSVAYNGPVTVQAGTGNGVGVPGPFHVDVTLTTPFLYDPSLGDLCIDTDFLTGAWGGGTSATMDIDGTAAAMASRVFSSSMYPVANGTTQNHGIVVEVTYAPAAGYATTTSFGNGCYQVADTSFYELFGIGTLDLANTSMSMFYSGTGYTVIGGVAAMFPTAAATALALTDNSEVTQTLTTGTIPFGAFGQANALTVCSNGFVSVGVGNGIGATPAAGAMLNAARTGWWCWHDYNPAIVGSGQVMWQETTTHVYVTWNNVFSAATTAPGNTFQFQFEKTTGHVHYVFGAMAATGNGHLVGFSEGGASADPGSIDLSAVLPATFQARFAQNAITLRGSARPVIGTSLTLNTTFVPVGSSLGATLLGLTEFNPGLDLTTIGMPGCRQFTTADAVVLFFSAPSASLPFNVPNDPGLAGVQIKAQSAALTAGANALGAVSSNGLRLTIDVN